MLFKLYNGDAGPAELDMFVVVVADAGNGMQIIPNQLPEDAGTGSMKNTDAGRTDLYGVVNEVGDCLESFVAPHASDVDFLFEV